MAAHIIAVFAVDIIVAADAITAAVFDSTVAGIGARAVTIVEHTGGM